jgi:hypothetical protein
MRNAVAARFEPMGKARVYRPVTILIVLSALAIGTCAASAQNQALDQPQKPGCAAPTAEISRISRPTGVLRADPNANDTASQKIASDIGQACPDLSDPQAARQVRIKMSDNNIILIGAVPTQQDEQVLLKVIGDNADGRTVFNRLEIASPK